MKHFLPHNALKSLYTLIQNHVTYGIQAWRNGNSIRKLYILQKHVIRIVNKTNYRCHTGPIFQSENILKTAGIYRLHVSLFLNDYQHSTLPKSFKHYTPENNLEENSIITRRHNLLNTKRPRTHFSSRLLKHNYKKALNSIAYKTQNTKSRSNVKLLLCKQHRAKYKNEVHCLNPICIECNSN